MKKRVILITTLLLIGTAIAQTPNTETPFSAMCIAEQSTGFNWRKGQWEKVSFKPEKYIVEKMKIENFSRGEPIPRSGTCSLFIQDHHPVFTEAYGLTHGCYNIREFGSEFFVASSKVCGEEWESKGGNWAIRSIFCEGLEAFTINPNGWFHHATINSDVSNTPKNDYKDSLIVDVGKCAVISTK